MMKATLVTMFGTAAAMKCPGSKAWFGHAGMEITTTASTSCDSVKAEVLARVAGQYEQWHDPHNNGTYTQEDYGGTMSFKRVTGNKKYTDKMIFTLTPEGDNACKIEACSESQVTSYLDFSTNYCNLKMLYCGKADGCQPVEHDFSVSSEKKDPKAGSTDKLSDCLKTTSSSSMLTSSGSMKCPGSKAWFGHAGMEITTTASASCDSVKAEALARVAGQYQQWHDPHNNGTYTQEDYGGTMSFKRVTGNKKYTDKMIFTLTPEGNNTCKIEACSESQVTSYLDFSTNYCNLKMLYCGKADGCQPVEYDFTTGEESKDPKAGSTEKLSDCLKVMETSIVI